MGLGGPGTHGGTGWCGQASACEPRAGDPRAPPGRAATALVRDVTAPSSRLQSGVGLAEQAGGAGAAGEPGVRRMPVPGHVRVPGHVPVPGHAQLSPLPVPAVAAPWFPLCSLSAPPARKPGQGRGKRSKPRLGERGRAGERARRCCGHPQAGRPGVLVLRAKQPVLRQQTDGLRPCRSDRGCGAGGHHCWVPLCRRSGDIPSLKLGARQPPDLLPPREQN
ncbi:collagen alpha-1(I) chain-like [Prinia subflava]|uniref:collagen alpha-1(I) chain-like n=1 Tax=Prinia subflava TaxID=208062 RepID=UPI002FE0348D